MFLVLLNSESQNLLLGFIPEPLGLMLFGMVLILVTVGARRLFEDVESEETGKESLEGLAEKAGR